MNNRHNFWMLASIAIVCVLSINFAWGQASVTVTPTPLTKNVGESFTYTVHVVGISNLLASRVTLTFDNSIIQYTGTAANGTFFPGGSASFFASNPPPDPTVNSVVVNQAVIGGPTLSGGGDLFTIGFTAIAAGSGSTVGITVSMRDSLNQVIPTSATGASITVNNPAPTTTSISPTSVTAGSPDLALTVYGTGFLSGVSVVKFDGSSVSTSFVSGTQLTATIPAASLTVAGAKSITVFNPTPGGGTSNAQTLTVNPASVDHFDFDAISSPQAAGTAFSITMTAKDAYGNVATGFGGTVNLSTTGGTISPTTSGTFSSGVRVEDVTVTLAGTGKTISANDGSGHTGTSGTFDVVAGAADHLVYVQQPTNATAGAVISPAVTVQLKDALGNDVPTSGVSVGMTLSSGTGTLSGTTPQSTDGTGLATFNNLSINLTGSKQLTAASGVLTSAVSSSFTISAGSATKVLVETAPNGTGTIVPSQSLTSGLSITAYAVSRDAFDNFVANVAATWSLTKTGGVVDGDLVPGGGGTSAVFTGHVIGTAVMRASFGGYTETPSGTITVNHGTLSTFAVEAAGGGAIGPQTQGVAFNIMVTAKDANGNTVGNFGETVDITSSGTLSNGGGTTPSFVNGVLASRSVTVTSTGSTAITATRTSGGLQFGVSNSFNVAAASFTIHATAGSNGNIVPSGDVVASYASTPSFTMTGSGNYHLGALLVDGIVVNPVSPYVFAPVTADHSIHARFAQTQYTVTGADSLRIDTDGDGTVDMTMKFTAIPYGGGTVDVFSYLAAPSGEPAAPPTSLAYYVKIVCSMPAHSFSVRVQTDMVNVSSFGPTSNLVYHRNTAPTGWVPMPGTYSSSDAVFSGHPSFSFTTDHFTNFTLFNAPSKNLYVGLNSTSTDPGTVYPNNTWTAGGYGADDWRWTGSQALSFYLVPQLNSVFNTGDVTLEWDNSVMTFAGAAFNGISFALPLPRLMETPAADSCLEYDDITVDPLNYIVMVNFTLLKPGHSALAVVQSSFSKIWT